MSNNPNFIATYSSDEVYFGQDFTKCLTDEVQAKASASHTHTDYATTVALDTLSEVVNGKANASHTHSEYATTSALNELSATVSGKANVSHSHNDAYYTEIEVDTKLADKANSSHNHNGVYDVSGAAANALTSANAYTDTKIDALVGEGASTTLDTISEISSAIEDNQDAIDLLNSAIGTKANASALTSHTNNQSNPHNVTLTQLGVTATATELNYVDGVISNIQTQLNAKAANSHAHSNATTTASGLMSASDKVAFDNAKDNGQIGDSKNITVANENLDDYTESGTYTFGGNYTPVGVPAGVNGWLVVMRWATVDSSPTVKQLWFRHGTLDTNDHEIYVRTRTQGENKWSAWSKVYTTSNPPTASEVGAAASNHNHNSAYISKNLQMTTDDGNAELQIMSGSSDNLLTKIAALGMGMHTFYSASGIAGNPKSTEAWRGIVFKTGANFGFVQAYGSIGSVYTNYLDGSNSWRGWRCIWDNAPAPLWSGKYYMHSPNSTPQTVTPSKTLSECRNGWLLLWSDYDADTGTANDTDFVTTMIPKRNPSGGTWGGKAFLCDIPRHIGSDPDDVNTEKRIMKAIYVHDDCIKGSYQNNASTRNDVVLRAVYEF